MIVWVLVFLLQIKGSLAACLSNSQFTSTESTTAFEMRRAEEVVKSFESLMIREIPPDHDLIIHLEPLNPKVNAEVTKTNNEIFISIWGGMITHPELTQNTLGLLLCHELGHFLGGPPLKSRDGWSSTEGQADYFSSAKCAKTLLMSEADFIEAALRLVKIYAQVAREALPSIERCDQSVVTRTNYGYPKSQCRLDTLMAGWQGRERPRCWFFE